MSYLKREIKKNNSMIYRALLKYGYSCFKLDIMEYCELTIIIKREQYYLDAIKPEYNILKPAGSLLGFKHSEAAIELMRAANIGRTHTLEAKLKMAANNIQAQPVTVTDSKTGEIKEFTSIRKAAGFGFIGVNHTYLARCLQKKNYIKVEVILW